MGLQNAFTDLATEVTLAARFGPSLGGPTLITGISAVTVYDPAAGMRPRLKWLYLAAPDTNVASTVATVSIGGVAVYAIPLGAPGIFAHGSVREGAVDALVEVTLSVDQPVYCNIDAEDF